MTEYSHYSVGFEFRIFATIRTIRSEANIRLRNRACVITIRKRRRVIEYRIFEIRWTALILTWPYEAGGGRGTSAPLNERIKKNFQSIQILKKLRVAWYSPVHMFYQPWKII